MINRMFPHWNWRHYATHPWLIVKDLWMDLKAFYQRGTRGYADLDVWAIDDYVAQWMPKALTRLKDNKIGYPMALDKYPDPVAMWEYYLSRMIVGFEAHQQRSSMEYKDLAEAMVLQRKQDEGLKLFAEFYDSLWD